jgi:hypothetical protein
MEGLSLLLKRGKEEGKLTGMKVARIVKILHLFFVDDVMIMTREKIQEWQEIADLLSVFIRASRLEINLSKSTFHYSGLQGDLLEQFKELFPYNFMDLNSGFQYMGYYLKPSSYKIED